MRPLHVGDLIEVCKKKEKRYVLVRVLSTGAAEGDPASVLVHYEKDRRDDETLDLNSEKWRLPKAKNRPSSTAKRKAKTAPQRSSSPSSAAPADQLHPSSSSVTYTSAATKPGESDVEVYVTEEEEGEGKGEEGSEDDDEEAQGEEEDGSGEGEETDKSDGNEREPSLEPQASGIQRTVNRRGRASVAAPHKYPLRNR